MKKEQIYRKLLINIAFIASIVVIGALNMWYTNRYNALNNTMDEFAYASIASYLAGHDWSALTSLWSSYYAYGYPLILAPLFFICNSYASAYAAAMTVNMILLIGSFCISVALFKKLFSKVSEFYIILGCLCITLYTSNLINTKWIWPEALTLFLFWLISYLIVQVTMKMSYAKLAIIMVLLAYSTAVHQRMVVLSIAAVMYLILLMAANRFESIRKNPVRWGIVLLCFLVLFKCTGIVKQLVTSEVYGNNLYLSGNNVSGVVGGLRANLSLEGLNLFIKGFAGKLFYFIYGTLFVGCFGVWFCIKKTIYVIRLTINKQKSQNVLDYISVFFLLVLAGSFMMNVLFMMGGGYYRHDTLIYGRYMEYVYGPILMLGLYEIYRNKRRWMYLLIFTVIGLASTVIVWYVWKTGEHTYYKSMFSPAIVYYFFYMYTIKLEYVPWLIFGIRTVITLLPMVCMTVFRRFKKQIMIFFVILCSFVWVFNALKYNKSAHNFQSQITDQYYTLANIALENPKVQDIYIVCGDYDYLDPASNAAKAKRIQVLLYDKQMKIKNVNSITKDSISVNTIYYVAKDSAGYEDAINALPENCMVYDEQEWTVYVIK